MVLGFDNDFTGEFRHNLDSKNRLTIPSKWRGNVEQRARYLLLPMPAGFIAALPAPIIQRLNEKASEVSLGDRKGQKALRYLFSRADTVICDGQGRIPLKPEMLGHCNLEKEALLVGTFTRFEIWNAEQYQSHFDADEEEEDDRISEVLRDLGI